MRRFHGWSTVIWICLIVPTVLLWPHSTLWIALMSVYACVMTHFGAWQAARAEDVARESNGDSPPG